MPKSEHKVAVTIVAVELGDWYYFYYKKNIFGNETV